MHKGRGLRSKATWAAFVVGIVLIGAVRADTLNPTTSVGNSATFNAVTITYSGTNSVLSVFGNTGTAASAVESVTFTGIGTGLVGIQIGSLPSSNGGSGDATFNACSASSCLGTTTPFYVNFVPSGAAGTTFSGLAIGGSGAAPTITGGISGEYDASNDQACYLNAGANFNACNTGASPIGVASISASGDKFTVQDASIAFTFVLPATPSTPPSSVSEPSIAGMLGVGLLALLGYRRFAASNQPELSAYKQKTY